MISGASCSNLVTFVMVFQYYECLFYVAYRRESITRGISSKTDCAQAAEPPSELFDRNGNLCQKAV